MKSVLLSIIFVSFLGNVYCEGSIDYLLNQARDYFKKEDFLTALKYIEEAKVIVEAKINEKYYSMQTVEIEDFKKFKILWKKYIGRKVKIKAKFSNAYEGSISFIDNNTGEPFLVNYSEKFTDLVLNLEKDTLYELTLIVIKNPFIQFSLLEIEKLY